MDLSFIGRKISGKTILVTGGTGSFGSEIVRTLLRHEVREIRIMSRDEDLQHQMALNIADKRLKFIIGDVRDESRINDACSGVQIIFHAAALKQVPDCENHPLEAVKTNILGAANVKRAAMLNGVKDIVAISTDKAVKPINAMGMTKALQEKIFTSDITGSATSKFSVVRYGNVMGSRGSVIPLFRNRVAKGLPLFVTDFRMTRFLLSLGDAVQLVFKALLDAKGGEIFVLKKKACLVRELAEVIAEGKVEVIEGHIRAG